MKETSNYLVQLSLTKYDKREVPTKTAELAFTREATDKVVKIHNGTYTKFKLDKVYEEAGQIYKYQNRKLLSIIT